MSQSKKWEEPQPILKKIENVLTKFIKLPTDMKTANETRSPRIAEEPEKIDYMYNVSSETMNEEISILGQAIHTNKVLDFNVYLKCFIHELRTPISTISMGLNLLENTDMPAENIQIVHDLFQSISFIETIFSKFAIIQDGNIVLNAFEPFSLNGIIQDIKNLLSFSIQETNIQLECMIDSNVYDWVYGDKYNMKHVIINLLKNAIKYRDANLLTKKSTVITIHIIICPHKKERQPRDVAQPHPPSQRIRSSFLTRRKALIVPTDTVSENDQTIQIIISDNNAYILPHIKQNLFETFNSTSGSGLGLYICKTIIGLHGGTIIHDYILPIGNKFTIELSMKCCHEEHLQKNMAIVRNISNVSSLGLNTDHKSVSECDDKYNIAPMAVEEECEKRDGSSLLPNKKPNVVLVDDSHLNRKMMYQILLQTEEFNQIYTAYDGNKCIQLMKTYDNINENIQIILLDKYMPVTDGLTTAKKLRELGYTNLIIGLTGTADPMEIQDFIQHGADYVLSKPMDKRKIQLLITFIKSYGTHRPQNKIIHCANNQLYWA
jgi:signal transduction histidine kinase/FixJ family two-component response regulator